MPSYYGNVEQGGLKGRVSARPGVWLRVLTVEHVAGHHSYETVQLIHRITDSSLVCKHPRAAHARVVSGVQPRTAAVGESRWDRGDNPRGTASWKQAAGER